ncbi:MAG: glycosyltransferase WbuB [Phycisphaeraceae bacterium]|nr:glycosyltransferase WbuB [Phycisphaeraceae bacterium]
MKLLFINQYYWPDMAATSQMMTDLCPRLVRAGHEVHVLCSLGQYDDGTGTPGSPTPKYELKDGVHIHRVKATGFGKKSMFGRVIDYLSFHLIVGLHTLLTGWKYGAIITLTTPPLIGLYATFVKWLTGTKHVCWVMDLHPDCEFELGVFKRDAILPRFFDFLNGLHFRHADRCVVLGSCMADRLRNKKVKDCRLIQIPVWGHELDEADPAPLREELGLTGKTVIMYSGNAGLIHTFDALCDAALQLRDNDQYVFLFVGGGKRIDQIKAFAQEHELANIIVRGYFPREQLAQSLRLADAHLITLRDGMEGVAVPCKLYGIMAASKPCIFIGPQNCETAQTISQYDAGDIIKTDDVTKLIQTIESLGQDTERWEQRGQNAYKGYHAEFNADHCAHLWFNVIYEIDPNLSRH